jgi:hypothetical protein
MVFDPRWSSIDWLLAAEELWEHLVEKTLIFLQGS